jgi:hypothetical protein
VLRSVQVVQQLIYRDKEEVVKWRFFIAPLLHRNEGWQTLTLAHTTHQKEPQPYRKEKKTKLAGHGEE